MEELTTVHRNSVQVQSQNVTIPEVQVSKRKNEKPAFYPTKIFGFIDRSGVAISGENSMALTTSRIWSPGAISMSNRPPFGFSLKTARSVT